jgi:NAD-dependent SIR2 family protein deacetylase
MRSESRLQKLEGQYGASSCPECGFDGDWSKVKYEVTHPHHGEERRPEHCPECGRPTRVVLRW